MDNRIFYGSLQITDTFLKLSRVTQNINVATNIYEKYDRRFFLVEYSVLP